MDSKRSEATIIDRIQNFRLDTKPIERFINRNPDYFSTLEDLKNEILVFCASDTAKDMSKSDLLVEIYSQAYNYIGGSAFSDLFLLDAFRDVEILGDIDIGDNVKVLNEELYEPCLFITLCSFLHTSKRIKGTSIKEFVRHYHSLHSDGKGSWSDDIGFLESEADRLRQYRRRLFSQRPVYIKNPQWAAIPKDAEHEWTFFYALEKASDIVQDTFKRMGNLYNNLYKVTKATKDSRYKDRLIDAYKSFMSSLRKIKYENYLELQKVILSHICEDTKYYGFDIYRFEKKMKPYITIREVNRLSLCQSVDEESDILCQAAILKDICFPTVYESFEQLPIADMRFCAEKFWGLLEHISTLTCFIFDELVEKKIFGDDWENFFRITINEIAEEVFYKPSDLKFTVTPKSQENFVDLISAPLNIEIYNETGVFLDF